MTWTDTKTTGSTLTAVEYNNLADHVRPTATATVAKSESADYLTTDYGSDDACIQAAIDYVNGLGGGSVLIREGTYTIEGQIELEDDIHLSGCGIGNTILTPNSDIYVFSNYNSTHEIHNVTISNLEIDCNNTGRGMLFDDPSGTTNTKNTIKNLYVHDSQGFGITILNAEDTIIDKCIFDNCGTGSTHHCVYFRGGSNSKISNSVFDNGYTAGIKIAEHDYASIVNCSATGNTRGFQVSADSKHTVFSNCVAYVNIVGFLTIGETIGTRKTPYDVSFSNCRSISNTGNGITLDEGNNITISNCKIISNAQRGIEHLGSTYACDGITITGSIIKDNSDGNANAYQSLYFSNVDNFVISANIFADSKGASRDVKDHITIDGATCDAGTISNNVVYNATRGGIYLSGPPTNILVSNNNCYDNQTNEIRPIGTTNRYLNNIGFNPVGNFAAPSVPATTVNYTNAYGYHCQVQVHGGTVTEIDIDDIATGLTSGIFMIPPSGTINITYSAAPSWRWWGL